MTVEILQATSTLAAVLSATAAILSGFCAYYSYKLAQKIKGELESDERLIASPLIRPGLPEADHNSAVLRCTLFNKSKRKVHIASVAAFDDLGKPLMVTWSPMIDGLGNTTSPSQLVGIVDSENLFVSVNDGTRIKYMKLEISHSFSSTPLILIYDPVAEWSK